jgi:ferric-dicitrate binding protein FerR (iron transport regulator)
MKEEDKYKEPYHFFDETEAMIAKSRIKWDKDKEQVWMELEKRMETEPVAETISLIRPWLRVAIAAGIALLVGFAAFTGFYTKTIDIPSGQHSEIYLPDNSKVSLNAQSAISYKPLLWRFSRTVKLEGEAYFDVIKGKQFEVLSGKGKTVVLGTTFNIYSRNSDYLVTCITGKVKVVEFSGSHEVTLSPGQQAALNNDGTLTIEPGIDTDRIISWLNNKLSFTSVPLRKVFEEIGRQYGVIISVPEDLDNTYTGTFIKESSVENVLNLVCRPFNLNFTRNADNEYIITGNN